jgi:hypothetical protein
MTLFLKKVIFNKAMVHYQGFLFQFCDIENLVSLSKNLTKLILFAQGKKKIQNFHNSFVNITIKFVTKNVH